MNHAVIKLESFLTPQVPQFPQSAVEQAYAEGYADGRAKEQNHLLTQLATEMQRLAESLDNDQRRRRDIHHQAVRALAPLLDEIIFALGSGADSQQLEAALNGELARLADMTAPLRCRISCSAEMRKMVEACLARNHVDGIELDETSQSGITLSLQGGHIHFDKDKIANEIRSLITEIKEAQQ